MGTTDTIIRVGTWQRATTDRGADLGRDVAPVIDGTSTIGHLWRYGTGDYQAMLISPGPGGCFSAHNPTTAPMSGDGVYRPAEHTPAHRFSSEFAALIALARHHHQI
jgi:hypothetical protein